MVDLIWTMGRFAYVRVAGVPTSACSMAAAATAASPGRSGSVGTVCAATEEPSAARATVSRTLTTEVRDWRRRLIAVIGRGIHPVEQLPCRHYRPRLALVPPKIGRSTPPV